MFTYLCSAILHVPARCISRDNEIERESDNIDLVALTQISYERVLSRKTKSDSCRTATKKERKIYSIRFECLPARVYRFSNEYRYYFNLWAQYIGGECAYTVMVPRRINLLKSVTFSLKRFWKEVPKISLATYNYYEELVVFFWPLLRLKYNRYT